MARPTVPRFTTWSQLEPSLRAELHALLAADRAARAGAAGSADYLSQYQDAMAWWLLLALACAGGIVTALYLAYVDGAEATRMWLQAFLTMPIGALRGAL